MIPGINLTDLLIYAAAADGVRKAHCVMAHSSSSSSISFGKRRGEEDVFGVVHGLRPSASSIGISILISYPVTREALRVVEVMKYLGTGTPPSRCLEGKGGGGIGVTPEYT